MKILICGDRNWTNGAAIERELRQFQPLSDTIIHGAARGADSIAAHIALRLGFVVWAFPARWDLYGRAAGPMRNQQMINAGSPDLVLAFHENIALSKGTKDMIHRANKRGIPTKVFVE